MASPRVTRCDLSTGPRAAVTRLGSGAVRLDAAVTRVGVLQYSDGQRTWGELKDPAEVFSPASLATLPGLPVTVDHPPELVTPTTWNDVAVGHVGDGVRPERDTGLVVAPVVVSDADTIARILSGDLVEVSAGYTCAVVEEEGVYDGVPYSARQTDILYNHAAVGPEGWGRAGADVKLRLNGGAVEVRPPRTHTTKEAHVAEKKNAGEPPATQPPEDMAAKCDALTRENAALQAALADALKANASMKADMENMKASPPPVTEEDVPPVVQDSIAAKRLALVEGARAVLGPEAKLDGKSAAVIHQEVVAKSFPSVKLDGLDAKHVAGMADAAMKSAASSRRSDALRDAHPGPGGESRNDAADMDPRDRLNRDTSNAWRTAKGA